MMYRGKECEIVREFSDGTGTGSEGLIDGRVVIRKYDTRLKTPEETSIEEQNASQDAKRAARIEKLKSIRDQIKAGTDTAADRTKAIRLLIGVVASLAPEEDET